MKREATGIPKGMRPGKRELNDASLLVEMSQAVPEHMRANIREITHFYVPAESRGKRLGTMLLNFVCQEADANKITLMLTAAPSEGDVGPDEEKLVAWYEKFGFMKLQQTPIGTLMARQVHEKPRLAVVPQARHLIDQAVRASLVH